MSGSPARSLLVVALGGNAISPPRGDLSFAAERATIRAAMAEIAPLARGWNRLLIVHGNGPQVGRLLAAPGLGEPASLDIHVAQTQGEMGYLLVEALEQSLGRGKAVALVTRALVDPRDPAFERPTKPVGAVLAEPPPGLPAARTPDGSGWRCVVASPRPVAVLEEQAIATLLRDRHVVAGGGGGIALAEESGWRSPQAAVIDKDWIAALLAVGLRAGALLFVTDVPHASAAFGRPGQVALDRLSVDEARRHLADGAFAPGSMGPKVESAVEFVAATGRTAVIAQLGDLDAALRGEGGTTIVPDAAG